MAGREGSVETSRTGKEHLRARASPPQPCAELALRQGPITSVQSPACEMPECRSSCQHSRKKASDNIAARRAMVQEMPRNQIVEAMLAASDISVPQPHGAPRGRFSGPEAGAASAPGPGNSCRTRHPGAPAGIVPCVVNRHIENLLACVRQRNRSGRMDDRTAGGSGDGRMVFSCPVCRIRPPLPCRASPPQVGRLAGRTGFPRQ
jgi:hypothetical protein